jgi:5'-AMP-activated protein kinase catalytic alpha subunit
MYKDIWRIKEYMEYQGMGMRSQFPVERKWALGLQVSF